jgi:hypothetical protein
VKRDEMDRATEKNAFRILVGKPEGKRPLRKPRRRLADNVIWVLEKYYGEVRAGFIWLRTRIVGKLL